MVRLREKTTMLPTPAIVRSLLDLLICTPPLHLRVLTRFWI